VLEVRRVGVGEVDVTAAELLEGMVESWAFDAALEGLLRVTLLQRIAGDAGITLEATGNPDGGREAARAEWEALTDAERAALVEHHGRVLSSACAAQASAVAQLAGVMGVNLEELDPATLTLAAVGLRAGGTT
jgi:hypothetical protein